MNLLLAVKPGGFSEMLRPFLSRYNVHICHTGTEALAMLEMLRPDILILDLCLPVIDGLSVLRQAHYKPPVILALTNLLTDNVLQEAAAVGVQDILLIPCTLQYILTHLNALIEKAPSSEA